MFDPATVGSSEPKMVDDLPGGASRLIREAHGVHGVFVNGVRVAGSGGAVAAEPGAGAAVAPGEVIRQFDPMRRTTAS